MNEPRKVLISVTKKDGLEEFARGLCEKGFEIVASKGTCDFLRTHGIKAELLSEYTGYPEILGGRVKTLHPAIYGGILAREDMESDMRDVRKNSISLFDIVVVNLYPFEETVRKEHTFEDAIENIDIGGCTLIRAAAKNFNRVAVITHPEDYPLVLREIRSHGNTSPHTRFLLARKAFKLTSHYDTLISNYFYTHREDGSPEEEKFPVHIGVSMHKTQNLRYGENPHQEAALYSTLDDFSIEDIKILGGKELSYTNLVDLNAAYCISHQFEDNAAVVIKHANPCGVARGKGYIAKIYVEARECDPLSAFGGIVGVNREIDAEAAQEIVETFIECVVAPAYTEEALEILRTKKNLRILQRPPLQRFKPSFELRHILGGMLIQERDIFKVNFAQEVKNAKVATTRSPTPSEVKALDFAWRVCAFVKSNAICFADTDRLVGVGGGQPSRVDSVKIAVAKAGEKARGAVMASDGFFPFRDGIDTAAEAGITAVIQPGGSKRDAEVIEAANQHQMAMLFTGRRHFAH